MSEHFKYVINVLSTDDATSQLTGAMTVAGGLGINKSAFVGTRSVIGNSYAVTLQNSGQTYFTSATTLAYQNSALNLITAVNNAGQSADTPYPVLNMIKPGVNSLSYDSNATFYLNKYTISGTAPFSELQLGLNHSQSATGDPNTITWKWRSDGTTLCLGTVDSTSSNSGALQVSGGFGLKKWLTVGGGAGADGTGLTGGIALEYNGGGFRHFIRSKHNATHTGNAIDFFLNNSTTAAGSASVGTGNVFAMSISTTGLYSVGDIHALSSFSLGAGWTDQGVKFQMPYSVADNRILDIGDSEKIGTINAVNPILRLNWYGSNFNMRACATDSTILPLIVASPIVIEVTNDSTSTTTGALTVGGGGAFAKNLYVGGSSVTGNVSLLGTLSGFTDVKAYPPFPLSDAGSITINGNNAMTTVTGKPWGNGVYYTSQSSSPDPENPGWMVHGALGDLIDGNFSTNGGYDGSGMYLEGTTTTDFVGTAHIGEWVQVQFPEAVIVKSIDWSQRLGAPATFALLGSLNGTKWTLILDQTTPVTFGAHLSRTITNLPINATVPYTHYRLVAKSTTSYGYFDGIGMSFNVTKETVTVNSTHDSQSTTAGSLVVAGGAAIAKNLHVGGVIVGEVGLAYKTLYLGNNGDISHWISHGFGGPSAVYNIDGVAINGGVGGGVLGQQGTVALKWLNGNVTIPNATDSTSTTTGALTVAGGASVQKHLHVGDSVIATTGVWSEEGRTSIGNNSPGGTGGLFMSWNTRNAGQGRAEFVNNRGLGNGGWEFLTTTGDATILTRAAMIYDDGGFAASYINLNATTDSSSSTTGALQIAGGLGVAKTLNVAGRGSTGVKLASIGQILFMDETIASATGPTLRFNAGNPANITAAGGTLNLSPGATVKVTPTTESTSSTTGALTVAGGVGISKSLNVGTGLNVTGISRLETIAATGPQPGLYLNNTTVAHGYNMWVTNTSDSIGTGAGSLVIYDQTDSRYIAGFSPIDGSLSVYVTTDSTSTTTGALTVAGGVGVVGSLRVGGTLTKAAGSFVIRHPDPVKRREHYLLRHCFVESPTRGDNLYRYKVTAVDGKALINLPDYFSHLNEDSQIWVSPVDHFGRGYGKMDSLLQTVDVYVDQDGDYNILIVGTRKDQDARDHFDSQGVEYLGE